MKPYVYNGEDHICDTAVVIRPPYVRHDYTKFKAAIIHCSRWGLYESKRASRVRRAESFTRSERSVIVIEGGIVWWRYRRTVQSSVSIVLPILDAKWDASGLGFLNKILN
ncbi:hypothetical protein CBL_14371 [Carabus blaptoides fortunei]